MKNVFSLKPRVIALIILFADFVIRFWIMSEHQVTLNAALSFLAGVIIVYILAVDGMANRRKTD